MIKIKNFAKLVIMSFAALLLSALCTLGSGADEVLRYDNFWYEIKNERIIIHRDIGEPIDIIIPNEIDGLPVTSISISAFSSCRTLKSIQISDSVVKIGDHAFLDCVNLESIKIPASVEYIGYQALGFHIVHIGSDLAEILKLPGFTIYGYPGTAAETYAVENGFKFVSLDGNVTPGDLDSSGTVDAADLVILAKHLIDDEAIADDRLYIADVNRDGEVTVKDLMLVVLFVSGKIPEL
jgi:hypothetical protein